MFTHRTQFHHVTRNGVTAPRANGRANLRGYWFVFDDTVTMVDGRAVRLTVAQLDVLCDTHGLHRGNARNEYHAWFRYNGFHVTR